jgi:hypothetical protein
MIRLTRNLKDVFKLRIQWPRANPSCSVSNRFPARSYNWRLPSVKLLYARKHHCRERSYPDQGFREAARATDNRPLHRGMRLDLGPAEYLGKAHHDEMFGEASEGDLSQKA